MKRFLIIVIFATISSVSFGGNSLLYTEASHPPVFLNKSYTDSLTSDVEFVKHRKFEDRLKSDVISGVALSFLIGKDAKAVKDAMGNKGLYPRIGFYFKYITSIEVAKNFSLVIGAGYTQKGWFERHDNPPVYSSPRNIFALNDLYVRTDYVQLYAGVSYRLLKWMKFRTGVDLGIRILAYMRTGRLIDGDVDYTFIRNSRVKRAVPNFSFDLTLGKEGGVTLDIGIENSGKVFTNTDYKYLMLKVGINYAFQAGIAPVEI